MEVVCTHSAVFSSLAPIWHQFGIKNGAGNGPRSSLNELGVNFWKAWWRREAKQVTKCRWDHIFFGMLVVQDAPRGLPRNSGTSHNGHIWYKPRLGPPKSESYNELRQGAEILIEIWSILDRFQWAKSWFYIGFTIISTISANRSIDSKITSFGTNKTRIFWFFGRPRRRGIDLVCDF